MKNSALVVIDLQNDITKNYKEIIEKVNEAIDWAVEKGLRVVYIQHNNLSAGTRTFKPGTHGAELVPEMKIVSAHIFTKSKSNALTSEAFTVGATPCPARHLPLLFRSIALQIFMLLERMPQPASNPPASIWQKTDIPSMCCRTVLPATTKRSFRRCLHIMKAKVVLL